MVSTEYKYEYTENCWFKGKCPREAKQGCDYNCNIQAEFSYLLNTSNIPKDYMQSSTLYPDEKDYEAFKTLATIKQDIEPFVNDGRFLYIWSKATGTGKAQPLYSKILTPNGYITMGEVRVGTEVIGEDGKPHKVLGVFPQGKKPVYELTFSDGTKCRCSDEHLWTISDNSRKSWKVMTLDEINKTTLYKNKHRQGKYGMGWKYHIPITKPIEFSNKDIELPLDPWLLGVLLGDGGFTNTTIKFTNNEKDIIDKVSEMLDKHECRLVHWGNNCDYGIVVNSNVGNILDIDNKSVNPIRQIIKDLGLNNHKSEEKFIPKLYLYGSVYNRLQLLRGLFDTDGTIGNGCEYGFSTSSKQLAEDIMFLVQSLGGTCTCNEHETFYTYKGVKRQGLNNFELYIKLSEEFKPYTSIKHTDRYKGRKKNIYRTLRKISYIGEEECQCIYVDNPSHLYLTDNMIVTHNTDWSTKLLKTYLAVKCVGNNFADRGWFEYVPSFLLLAKEFENPEARKEHIDNTMKRDLVILDDIGAVQNSNYDISTLSNIIDYRYSNGLATIITGNIEPAKLESSIGVRLADRVLSDIAIEFKGGSNRTYTNTYARKG